MRRRFLTKSFVLPGVVKRIATSNGRLAGAILATVLVATFVWYEGFLESNIDNSEWLLHMVVDTIERRNFSQADNVTGYPEPIVPNIVHFIRFDNPEFDFYDMINIRSVYFHQRPERILLHCNFATPIGHYWKMVKDLPGLEIRYLARPTHIFGRRLGNVWHAGDIARILVLTVYGGIFLDNDVYVVRSLDRFRHFEFAIGWPPDALLGTQVLVAHKDARFLRLWYQTYRDYHPEKWYFNAGELPTTSILYKRPELVHRVPELFGVRDVTDMLYRECSPAWRQYYSIHLMKRHTWYKYGWDYFVGRKFSFDEENVMRLNSSFGEMARLVLYGKTQMLSK